MSNFGFISKKKIATEIAKAYNGHNNTPCNKEQFLVVVGYYLIT